MKKVFGLATIAACVYLTNCKNLDDATISSRNTFIKLFEAPYDMTAVDIEPVADGYVILGNIAFGDVENNGEVVADSVAAVVFRTDFDGNLLSDYEPIFGGTGKSIKPLPGGGYIVVGDYIKTDLTVEQVGNTVIASAFIAFVQADLTLASSFYISDTNPDTTAIKTDYYGGTVTVKPDGEIIILGTYVDGIGNQINIPAKPFIISLNPDHSLKWVTNYSLVNRNYQNSKSVHLTSANEIIWASSITRELAGSKFEYLQVSVVEENSTFENASTVGTNTDQLFTIADIQPAKNEAFGYGIVGTFSRQGTEDGSASNMFFYRTDKSGTFIPGSGRFFDAVGDGTGVVVDSAFSVVRDEGHALIATRDGGFAIAGNMLTSPGVIGNGDNDLFLVKLGALGDILWTRTIGGSGNEVASSILETADRGLLVCGTNTLGNASVIFLIKMDRNGDLKN